jgi:hypothetical protein
LQIQKEKFTKNTNGIEFSILGRNGLVSLVLGLNSRPGMEGKAGAFPRNKTLL